MAFTDLHVRRTKVTKKRRKEWDGSEDGEQEESDHDSAEGSGDEAINKTSPAAEEDEDEDEEDDPQASPKLGRGARGRAKVTEIPYSP